MTPDQEAEIEDEVRKEINYRFGTEPGVPEKKEEPGEAAADEEERDSGNQN